VETSESGAVRHRLNARYTALIDANRGVIRGATVLDLASHDGRFSFAALQAEAEHVVGVEYEVGLVEKAVQNLQHYGVTPHRYDFVVGDLFAYLDRPKPCDVVFCFGILYHTTEHMRLLSRIAELLPRHLIIDTNVSRRESAVIELRNPLTGYPPRHGGELEAYPTTAALDAMLSSFGWSYTYFNWEASGLTSHPEMQDYGAGRRVSVVVDCMKPSISIAEQQAAVAAVRARRHDHRSQWPTIKDVAAEYAITPQVLRTLLRRADRVEQEARPKGRLDTG